MLNKIIIAHFFILLFFSCSSNDKNNKNQLKEEQQVASKPYVHIGGPKVDILYNGYVKPIEGKTFLPGAKPDGSRKVASTISLIRTKDMIMVADPGMTAKGDWKNIILEIEHLGIKKEDVTHVFISHHHPDHNTKVGIFPNATVVDFWATYNHDDWNDHSDKYEISEGVTIIKTPGHTHEDASLLVETEKGTYLLTHMWWNNEFGPEKDPLAQNQEELDKNRAEWVSEVDWIVPGHGAMFKNPKKKEKTKAELAVQKAAKLWVKNFNKGNIEYCINVYQEDAVMNVKPVGTFKGRKAIGDFWKKMVNESKASFLVYRNTRIKQINENTVHLASDWTMNIGEGIITKEEWVKGKDGIWKFKSDSFEIKKQY